jgi:hypothetical protein
VHLPFEQIDEAAGEAGLGIAAGIERNKVAHGAGQNKALDLPDAKRRMQPIANLDQDDFVAAAAFAWRPTGPAVFVGLAVQIMCEVFGAHRR